jgi:hypothetical protein
MTTTAELLAKTLGADLNKDLVRLEEHLAKHKHLLDAWKKEQPQWIEGLRSNPQDTVDRFLKHMLWDGPPIALKRLPN